MLRNYRALVHVVAVMYITKSSGNPTESAKEAFISAMDELSNAIYQLRNQATFKDEMLIKNELNNGTSRVLYNAIYLLSPSRATKLDDGNIMFQCSTKSKSYQIDYSLGSYAFTGDFDFNGYHNFNISLVDMSAKFKYKNNAIRNDYPEVHIITKKIHMNIDICKIKQDLGKQTIKEIAANFTTSLTKFASAQFGRIYESPSMSLCGRDKKFIDTYTISESSDAYNCTLCISPYNVTINGSLNWNEINIEYMNKVEYKFNATVKNMDGITEWNYKIGRNGTFNNFTTHFRINSMKLIGEYSGADKKFTVAKDLYMDINLDPIQDDKDLCSYMKLPAILEPLLKNELKRIIRYNFLQ